MSIKTNFSMAFFSGGRSNLIQSHQAGLTDIQLILGHQRATTTDIYLKSVSPDINHLAAIIECAVQPASSRAHEAEVDR